MGKRLGITLLLLVVAGLAVLGALTGRSLLKSSEIVVEPAAFGMREAWRVPRGVDWGLAGRMRRLGPEAEALYEEARLALDAVDTVAALMRLGALLERDPGFHPARWQNALLLLGPPGSPAAASSPAEKHIRLGLEADSADPWLLYARGLWHARSGRPDSAEAGFLVALKASPSFPPAYAALGELQLAQGKYPRAKKSFRQALALLQASALHETLQSIPGFFLDMHRPYAGLARTHYALGEDDSAWQVVDHVEAEGVPGTELLFVKALLLEAGGRFDQAREQYQSILRSHPARRDVAEALRTLGLKPPRARLGSGPPSGEAAQAAFAISLLEPLAKMHHRNGPLWLALGQAYFHRGHFALASQALDSSVKLDTALAQARELRDMALARWQEEAEAWRPAGGAGAGEGNRDLALRREAAAHATVAAAAERARDRGRTGGMPETSEGARAAGGAPQELPASEVVLPGSIALLGTYTLGWGSAAEEAYGAYPNKSFSEPGKGRLRETFLYMGALHEQVLAYGEQGLWGVHVAVRESLLTGDLFGGLIRLKTKISGEGRGTGEALCPDRPPFQGAIWQNDDTFEFMAQFHGKPDEVRLVRVDAKVLPEDKRLCSLVRFFDREVWKPR